MLIEKPGRLPGQMAGRSPYLNAVHLDAPPELAGSIVPVRILAASANSLAGELAA
jgi:tRNA-2-methylthio-N6-dimethylallyladenosine synthase